MSSLFFKVGDQMSVLKLRDANGNWVAVPALQGENGYSPIRGKDYWTDEDIAAMKSYMDDEILGREITAEDLGAHVLIMAATQPDGQATGSDWDQIL